MKLIQQLGAIVNQVTFKKEPQSKFGHERKLLNGQYKTDSTHKSLLFFTVHKCASLYVKTILYKLTEGAGLTPVNLAAYLLSIGTSIDTSEKAVQEKLKEAFRPFGYCYAPLRFPELLKLINNLEDYRILLMLRDPRDVLTSAYFSFGYSHSIPEAESRRGQFLSRREKILHQTIDQYVIENMSDVLSKYNDYCRELLGKSNVLLVRYEDMIDNFENWLGQLIEFLKPEVDQGKIIKIIDEADFTVEKEDISSHKRQVTPGDHKRKLKPETIMMLNRKFNDILDSLGYER